jgi:hypothetical protein
VYNIYLAAVTVRDITPARGPALVVVLRAMGRTSVPLSAAIASFGPVAWLLFISSQTEQVQLAGGGLGRGKPRRDAHHRQPRLARNQLGHGVVELRGQGLDLRRPR